MLSLSLWSAIADWIRVLTNGDDREGGVQNLVSEGRVKADGQQVRTVQAHETVARRTVRLPVVKVNHIIKKEREKKNPRNLGGGKRRRTRRHATGPGHEPHGPCM